MPKTRQMTVTGVSLAAVGAVGVGAGSVMPVEWPLIAGVACLAVGFACLVLVTLKSQRPAEEGRVVAPPSVPPPPAPVVPRPLGAPPTTPVTFEPVAAPPSTGPAAPFAGMAPAALDVRGRSGPVAAGAGAEVTPSEPIPVRAEADVAQRLPVTPPTLDADVVLSALMESVSAVAKPVAAHLWLRDDASGSVRLIESVGPLRPSTRPVPLQDGSVLARACEAGTAEFGHLADIKHGGRPVSLWRYALPVAAGEARGIAAVDLETSEGEPDISGFPGVTAPLRGPLSGALALRVARSELETARALTESVHSLSRMLDPDEVLDATLARALELSGGQTCSVMLLDPDARSLRIVRSQGIPQEIVERTSLSQGEGIAGWVLASRKSVLVEDVAARPGPGQRHGVRSAVSVPIADDDGIMGVLNVGSRSYPARFTASHCDALETLGRQCATALRNAQAVVGARELYFDTVKALAIALETKDPFSTGGTERVLECAEAVGAVLGIGEDERDSLRIAALVHDLGMASAGEGVLTSARPLTTVERALLRLHPKIAAEMLRETPALRHVVPIVYHHHEWYDGNGYVSGLAGEGIPLGARILAVADAFVSITSDRPYRRARSKEEALAEIRDKTGTQFDSRVVDALAVVVGEEENRVPESAGS